MERKIHRSEDRAQSCAPVNTLIMHKMWAVHWLSWRVGNIPERQVTEGTWKVTVHLRLKQISLHAEQPEQ
jgi:hypothetical protein